MANPTLSDADHPTTSDDPGPLGALTTAVTAVLATLAALVMVTTLSGCASRVDGQWHDPSLQPAALRGARVLVVCEAEEAVVQRLCVEKLAAAVAARGGTAVLPPENLMSVPATHGDSPLLAAAREHQARAVIVNRVTPNVTSVGSPSGVRFGIGGFGFGGGGVYSGLGMSVPVGGGSQTVSTHYAANTRLLDPSGKLLWTAKASVSSTSSNDLQAQLDELTRTVFAAIDKSSLF